MFRFILFLVFSLQLNVGYCQAQDLYNFQNSAAFADHLYQTRQFSLAAAEYERLLFMAPSSDSLQLRLVSAYQQAGDSHYGIRRVEALHPQADRMPEQMALLYSKMLLQEKHYEQAESFLASSKTIQSSNRYLLLSLSNAMAYDWQQADQYLEQARPTQHPVATEYALLLHEVKEHKYKSPALAASLSAIVPGAGKVYTKDWKDGLIAFVMVGSSAWQAYRSFNRVGSSSVRGWIYASVGTGFYIGNIFGAHKSARNYNEHLIQKTHQKVENLFYTRF